MAIIQRPGKEGNATTYQGKVAAGYTKILAQEVDADIDALFTAWNLGVDTVNIKDGSVTPAKLAPGAVTGSALAPGSVGNAALAPNAVGSANIIDGSITGADVASFTLSDTNIANVAWGKLIAPYANAMGLNPRGMLTVTDNLTVALQGNDPNGPAYDVSKPSWMLRLNYSADEFEIWRASPPGTSYTRLLYVTSAGLLTATLADSSVARSMLQVNAALNTTFISVAAAAGFTLTVANTWTTYQTLPVLNTRGGFVWLVANPGLSAIGPTAGGLVSQRWLRDGNPIPNATTAALVMSPTAYVPVAGVNWIDNPNAGAHTYAYQCMVNTSSGLQGTGTGGFFAVEVG